VSDYWEVHGILFLIGAAIFPRTAMLVATAVSFGWLAWVGWLFAPHVTVAILATSYYWHTNPVLCICAWLFALGGTGVEAGTAASAAGGR
jgi:hypothetical protein